MPDERQRAAELKDLIGCDVHGPYISDCSGCKWINGESGSKRTEPPNATEIDLIDSLSSVMSTAEKVNRLRIYCAAAPRTQPESPSIESVAIKLLIGRRNNVPWNEVPDSEVEGWRQEAIRIAKLTAPRTQGERTV